MDSQFWANYLDKKSEYEKGYADAVEKACEWIKSNIDKDEGGEMEYCFRKAMEE